MIALVNRNRSFFKFSLLRNMSHNLPAWRSLSRREVIKAHSDSQFEWMSTDEHVLNHLDYRQILVLYHSEKSKKLHRLNFFRLLFLRSQLLMDAEAIINVWYNSYVKDFHEWMHELKQRDEEWMETIDGLKFHTHLGSITEDIPCTVRVEFGCTHCRKTLQNSIIYFVVVQNT